jgi:hypothetical protein
MILPIMGLNMIQVFCTSEVMTDLISLEAVEGLDEIEPVGAEGAANLGRDGRLDEP